ncbi:hypothetical protein JCM11641_001021, partial [Rhodosporidiobolus odoratus]
HRAHSYVPDSSWAPSLSSVYVGNLKIFKPLGTGSASVVLHDSSIGRDASMMMHLIVENESSLGKASTAVLVAHDLDAPNSSPLVIKFENGTHPAWHETGGWVSLRCRELSQLTVLWSEFEAEVTNLADKNDLH